MLDTHLGEGTGVAHRRRALALLDEMATFADAAPAVRTLYGRAMRSADVAVVEGGELVVERLSSN